MALKGNKHVDLKEHSAIKLNNKKKVNKNDNN